MRRFDRHDPEHWVGLACLLGWAAVIVAVLAGW